MSTPTRTRSNRSNAKHSTGPNTDAGKLASRRNALRLGLSGDGAVVHPDDQPLLDRQIQVVEAQFPPHSEMEAFFVSQTALAMLRLRRAQALLARLSVEPEVSHSPDDLRSLRDSITQRGRALFKEFSADAADTLSRTVEGIDFLIERWTHFRAEAETGRITRRVEFMALHGLDCSLKGRAPTQAAMAQVVTFPQAPDDVCSNRDIYWISVRMLLDGDVPEESPEDLLDNPMIRLMDEPSRRKAAELAEMKPVCAPAVALGIDEKLEVLQALREQVLADQGEPGEFTDEELAERAEEMAPTLEEFEAEEARLNRMEALNDRKVRQGMSELRRLRADRLAQEKQAGQEAEAALKAGNPRAQNEAHAPAKEPLNPVPKEAYGEKTASVELSRVAPGVPVAMVDVLDAQTITNPIVASPAGAGLTHRSYPQLLI